MPPSVLRVRDFMERGVSRKKREKDPLWAGQGVKSREEQKMWKRQERAEKGGAWLGWCAVRCGKGKDHIIPGREEST